MVRYGKPALEWLLALCLMCCGRAFAQSLVYSLSYVDTTASFKARSADVSPAPGLRTHEQNLAMMRGHRKTEIFAVAIADGKSKLVFSDEDSPLELIALGFASSEGKIFVKAILRTWRDGPSPGVTADRALYELYVDGSNKFSRILADEPNQSAPILNARGSAAAIQTFDAGKYFISTYSIPGWKLVRRLDLSDLMNKECAACTPVDFGWMADGERICVGLTVVGEDEDSGSTPGTYVLSKDGSAMTRIPDDVAALRLDGYMHPQWIERRFLGQLQNGSYIFEDFGVSKGKQASSVEPFLVSGNASGVSARPLKRSIGRAFISASGRYLAYLENRTRPDYRSEQHLWVKDLQTGDDKELLSVPPPGPPSSPKPNVFLGILGWTN